MASVIVEAVAKRFGATEALRELDLTVEAGEAVALTGPNGVGKSTLLRILATTVLPDSGRVTVCGHDGVAAARDVRRHIGVLSIDERSWQGRISARRNLEFHAALGGLRRAAAAARCAVLLEEVGLGAAAGRRVEELSAGMRLRLALARALLVPADVLLLDEPGRSLDAEGRDLLHARLREICRDGGTVVLATHDRAEIGALGARTVVLAAGRPA